MNRILLVILSVFFVFELALADKVCARVKLKNNKAKLVKKIITSGNCPAKFTELIDTSVLVGPQGEAGPQGVAGSQGADGALRVWGDGSDGNISPADLAILDPRKQYHNITIEAGRTVYFESQSTIRCTGTLTINGEFAAGFGVRTAGFDSGFDGSTYFPSTGLPLMGVGSSAAKFPECAASGSVAGNGGGGAGMSANRARMITKVGVGIYGGSGSGGVGPSTAYTGPSVAVYCKEGIIISGDIDAKGINAINGGGGSGGGIVILASNGSITHSGTINVRGGDGGDSTVQSCAGGGGGGGFVHFISPSISNTGTANIAGGDTGADTIAVTSSPRCAGGGGGATYGSGGTGYYVTDTDHCSSSTSSSSGAVISSTVPSGSVEALIM